MRKSLELAGSFLATQLNYIPALFIIFTLYFGILKEWPQMWKICVLALVPFGFYLVRYYVTNIPLYFILQLLHTIWPNFLAENLAERIVFLLLSLIYLGISIYFKVKNKKQDDSILFAAMVCIIAIICYFSTVSGMGEKAAGYVAILAIIYVVEYMLYLYITGYVNYVKNNEVSNQNIPTKHILKTSFGALAGFLTLFTGFALLLVKGNLLADLIYKIGDALKRFLIWLMSFAPDPIEQATPTAEEIKAMEAEEVEAFNGAVEAIYELPPEVVELIDKFVTIGAYLIASVGIIIITYAIFKMIVESFRINREDGEEEIKIVKEKVVKLSRQSKGKQEKDISSGKDKKIRKLYEDLIFKKQIAILGDKGDRRRKIERLKFKTPSEQCKDIRGKKQICAMYEKARYSDACITKEDVRMMKEFIMLENKNSN